MELANRANGSIRKCAFCKYWDDPDNTAIQAENEAAGFWRYDSQRVAICERTGQKCHSFEECKKFSIKI